MNEETIIKALEICPTSSCARCPLRKRVDCRNFLLRETLKLIRSKAEQLEQTMEQLTAAERRIDSLRVTMAAVVKQHKIIVNDQMEQINSNDHYTYKTDEGW